MMDKRNGWAEGQLDYIGTGATTIEAIGDGYAKIKTKIDRAENNMVRHRKTYSLHCDYLINKKMTAQDHMEGDIQAGLFPSQKKDAYSPEKLRQA
jgi:hypothetical protein